MDDIPKRVANEIDQRTPLIKLGDQFFFLLSVSINDTGRDHC